MQRIQKSNSSFLTNNQNNKQKLVTGTVVYVHINDTEFESITIPDDITSDVSDLDSVLGFAKIVEKGDTSYDFDDLNDYPPFNIDEGLPLLGEVVELIKVGGNSHYKRIHNIDINAGNAVEDAQLQGLPVENSDSNSSGYSETSQTGTPNSGGDGDRSNKLGEYFEPTQINPLVYYEGDKVIQSRFGQSIRFSGYNNEENVFAPTILIRNRQNDKSIEDLKEFEVIIKGKLEDTNAELKYLREALNRKNDTGTDATSGNSKVMEDGAETAEKENLNQLAVRQMKFAQNLENALMRIKNGTYGVCIDSGKLISKERLRLVPHTQHSIEAKLKQK